MGKLANLAASRGIILPDETALRLSIRAELKNHEIPPPKIRLRHYRAVDQNEMDHLSDTIRENLSLEYPPDLVNSLVKQVITMDETAARASAKAAAKREARMAQLDLKKELETATVESGDRISLVRFAKLSLMPETDVYKPNRRKMQFNCRQPKPPIKVLK